MKTIVVANQKVGSVKSTVTVHLTVAADQANLKNNEGAAMALEALGLVLPVRMHERVIYADTFAHGKTALETEPHGVAAQEVAALWQAVRDTLGLASDVDVPHLE